MTRTIHVAKTRAMVAQELATALDLQEWEAKELGRLSAPTLVKMGHRIVPGFQKWIQIQDEEA